MTCSSDSSASPNVDPDANVDPNTSVDSNSNIDPNTNEQPKKTPSKPPRPKEESPLFKEFMEKLITFETPEEKISHGLLFMRSSISQEGSPHFREFWDARRIILPLFKENLNPAIRSQLWNEYVELTVEARRLKEILEEQSSFAMEQIDLAINALVQDLENFDKVLGTTAEIKFPESSHTIRARSDLYNQIQRELNLLNTLASRLNSLRKEIIKTDMRIRFKTKFFKRLSELGDQIFPKRKELIEQVSQEFEKDVDNFVESHFQGDEIVGAPYYALREEIKALQSVAKIFTLNSAVFTRTRLKLSECWDKVKMLEKEHKKEIHEKRQVSTENRELVQERIGALKGKTEEISLNDLNQEIDVISQEMRGVSLTRDDVKHLRSELYALREPHLAAQEKRAKELEEKAKEKLKQKREQIASIKEKTNSLVQTGDDMDLEVLEAEYKELHEIVKDLDVSKMERQQLERFLRPLRDLVADKREHSLLNLSEDEKKTLENLKLVLKQKKERRLEIKAQLEIYRKALGGSNLDFEKAMHYQELAEQEKERFDKAAQGIGEIEQKIRELES